MSKYYANLNVCSALDEHNDLFKGWFRSLLLDFLDNSG